MKNRRWLKSAIAAAETEVNLPWARGNRRARWKAAARKRARAA